MEQTLFNENGEPVAYISNDQLRTIYLWDGHPVAYLYDYHVYGFNGRHLGWFINGVVYDSDGSRVGFTATTAPIAVYSEPAKAKRYPLDKIESKSEAPSLPELGFTHSDEGLAEFLKRGVNPLQTHRIV
jgi:hypothetical protein